MLKIFGDAFTTGTVVVAPDLFKTSRNIIWRINTERYPYSGRIQHLQLQL